MPNAHVPGDRGSEHAWDEHVFDGMTPGDSRRLEAVAARALVERGVDVTVRPGILQDGIGRTYGLRGLAARCRIAAPEDWPLVAAELLELGVSAHRPSELDPARTSEQVCFRLVNRHFIGEELAEAYAYGRAVAGDLVELLVVPHEGGVSYLRSCDVERLGAGELRATALENLLRAPLGREKVIEWPYGVRVHEVWHPVWEHTASKLLVFRDVLRRVLGTDDFRHGVLVIAPTKQELAFLPIEVCQAFGALVALGGYAREAFGADPGGLTHEVFWWRDGVLRTVLAEDEEEGLDPEFTAMMMRVAEEERDRELGATP
jgi:hypothetical protein